MQVIRKKNSLIWYIIKSHQNQMDSVSAYIKYPRGKIPRDNNYNF